MSQEFHCPKCSAPIHAGDPFCGQCGQKLIWDQPKEPKLHFCPQCGKAVKGTEKFCSHCGAPLDMGSSATDYRSAPRPRNGRSGKDFAEMYFSFNGRLNRKPYIIRLVLLTVAFILFILVLLGDNIDAVLEGDYSGLGMELILSGLLIIPYEISIYSLSIRRAHDCGKGLYYGLLPVICDLLFLFIDQEHLSNVMYVCSLIARGYLAFSPGEKGPNQYGEDPLKESPLS